MRAYVLCGGFGTRLRNVIRETQKAMVEVHGEPFLAHVLRQLDRAEINEAVLCAHYRADQLAERLDSLADASGLTLKMVIEAEPLGTGGALLNALHEHPPLGRYLALNADTYLESDAYQLAAQAHGSALVTVRVEERSRYGALVLDDAGHLLSIREKGAAGPGPINAGVYAFTENVFITLPPRPCSLEHDLLPWLIEQETVQTLEYTGRFIDIGTPESLIRYTAGFYGDQTA